jgi:hypothetical protein
MKTTTIIVALAAIFVGVQSNCGTYSARGRDTHSTGLAFHGVAGRSGAHQASRIYPYSVIPGGIDGDGEFQAYRAVDKQLASHYLGIGDHLTAATLSTERWLYASYRVPEGIYWTKNRIAVHQGEVVLTDGSNFVRARCGNRLSERPQMPVRKFEPPAVTTDLFQPGQPFVPEELPAIPPAPLEATTFPVLPAVVPPSAHLSLIVASPANNTVVPLPATGSTGPSIWLPPPASKGPPSILVPEIHTSTLMLSGLLILLAFSRLAARRRAPRPLTAL